MPSIASVSIRPGLSSDLPLIAALIRELAEYERLTDSVAMEETELGRWLFGPAPHAHTLIASVGDVPAGFALWFPNFSTFLGRPGIYLEDLFVRPAFRGHGAGRALLARLAATAVERGYGRVEWSVLDWNQGAIGFYRGLGAEPNQGWTTYRLAGDALRAVATL